MIIFQSIVKPLDITTNKELTYLVTSSDKRNTLFDTHPNILGIRMKKVPSSNDSSFWLDSTYEENIRKFDEDVSTVKSLLERRGLVVLSPSLLGEDLDKMEIVSPKTAKYMKARLEKVLNVKRKV